MLVQRIENPIDDSLTKRIALVAHDHKKPDLMEWAAYNRMTLAQHEIFATGTTGRLLESELGMSVQKLQSGPLGGDQQIGAKISEGLIDLLIFFWDPLRPQPHDPDVKALLRIAVVWNIPVACNRTTADYLISSPLMVREYKRMPPDHEAHLERAIATQRKAAGMSEGDGSNEYTLDAYTIDEPIEVTAAVGESLAREYDILPLQDEENQPTA